MSKSRPKILMSFCTDWYWYDVAKALATSQVNLAFLVSRPVQVQARARKELKKTIVINQDTLEYASEIEKLNVDNPVILSAEMLNQLKETELEFLQITDRLAFFQLTVGKRRHIFKELVRFWIHFLETNKIDAIFLTDTPHVGFDTALFAVAKEFFNLPIVSIRRPFIRDRMITVHDYREFLPNVPESFLAKVGKGKLVEAVGEELMSDVFSENFWQKKDKVITNAIHAPDNTIIETFRRVLQSIDVASSYNYITSLFEKSTYGGFNYNTDQIKLVEKLCGLYHRYYLKKQRTYYDELAANFSLPAKYIYFPLHLQPERSTIPEGGVFEDQFLALEILQEILPKGWLIVVKEHPRQFHKFDFQKHHFRSIEFYKKLTSLPSIRVCPMNIPQDELVAKAQVTATITGTGGWESLLIGKPAIVFGNTWYSGCQSCYVITSVEEARNSIKMIRKSNSSQVELDVYRFLAYYRERLVIASNAKEFAEQSHRPYKTLISNMAKAVVKEIKLQL